MMCGASLPTGRVSLSCEHVLKMAQSDRKVTKTFIYYDPRKQLRGTLASLSKNRRDLKSRQHAMIVNPFGIDS